MRYENQKRLTLLSKDAVRSNNTFKWNNIQDLGLLKDSTIQVSNFDVKSSSVIPVGPGTTEYVSLPEDNSVSTDNLIAHFKFENDLTDSVENYTLTDRNSYPITFDNSIVKKGTHSAFFEARTGYYLKNKLNNFNILGGLSKFSFCFWLNILSFGNSIVSIIRQNGTPLRGIYLKFQTSTNIQLLVTSNNSISYTISTAQYNSLFNNNWGHITLVVDLTLTGTDNAYKLYLNGVQILSDGIWNDPSFTVYPNQTEQEFLLGTPTTNNNSGINGNLDEFRIYSRLLTTDEISRLIGEVQKQPLIHYQFQKNLIDTSGNNTLLSLDSGTIEYNQDITKNAEYSLKQNTGILTISNNNNIAGLINLLLVSG